MINQADGFDLHLNRPVAASPRTAFALTALFLSLLIIYANSFHSPWYVDDYGNILDNPNISSAPGTGPDVETAVFGRDATRTKIDRPLSYLSFALNFKFGGNDVFSFHLVNFAIHYAATAVLFLFLCHLLHLPVCAPRWQGQAEALALLAAFFWATHPIQVTAVTYLVQRMAALAALFSLLALWFWSLARTGSPGPKRWLCFFACLVSGFCALASKENSAMLPVSIWIYDLFFIQGINRQNLIKSLKFAALPMLFVGIYGLWQIDFTAFFRNFDHRPFTLSQRVLTEPRILIFYFRQLIYPVSESFTLFHDVKISTSIFTPWATLPSMAALALAAVMALVWASRAPLVSFALLFFLVNHLIESSFLPLELIFEHRNYLPSLFFFIPIAMAVLWGVERFSTRPAIQWFLALTVSLVLAAQGHTTYLRNDLFSDPIAMWTDNVKKSPNLHRPHHNLGLAYLSSGQWSRGMAETVLALEAKPMARPNQKHISTYNLAAGFLRAGNEENALYFLEKTLKLLPNHPGALNQKARVLFYQGDLDQAERLNAKARAIAPKNPGFQVLHGFIQLRRGRPAEAFRIGQQAWQEPGGQGAPTYFLMGEACRVTGKIEPAEYFFSLALECDLEATAPLLALMEISVLQNDPAALAAQVRRLFCRPSPKGIKALLAAFDRRYNCAGPQRMARLAKALDECASCAGNGSGKRRRGSVRTGPGRQLPGADFDFDFDTVTDFDFDFD